MLASAWYSYSHLCYSSPRAITADESDGADAGVISASPPGHVPYSGLAR